MNLLSSVCASSEVSSRTLTLDFLSAIILSMIVQTIYPIRRHAFRSNEYLRLEKLLDKWYYELPEHLRFDPASQKDSSLPPHCLTLHLHYWCTVLLLHRPLWVPCHSLYISSHQQPGF